MEQQRFTGRDRTRPDQATIKRLFAHSGNRCAFPGCTAALFEADALVGDICHIKAAKPGGPRYDPQQTPAERHRYGNLVVLCKKHHAVVDRSKKTYTAERLQKMKADHEEGAGPADDALADRAARRVETINKLYKYLCDARDWFQAAVRRVRFEGDRPMDECGRQCEKAAALAQETLAEERPLIPPKFADDCDRFFATLARGLADFALALDPRTPNGPQRAGCWDGASKIAYEDLPRIVQEIEGTARNLINGL